MLLATIEIPRLTVQVRGPTHIGTGFARGLVNRTVVKGRDGLVYVPASVLKGKTRAACESLARRYGLGNCRAPHAARMIADRETCLACRIFGAPGQGTGLRWRSARLTEDWQKALRRLRNRRAVLGQTITRTQVQLNRTRGLAAEARLFTSEFAAEGLTFEAEPACHGRLWLTQVEDEHDVYYELIVLLAALKLVNTLGGGASRGAGECEIALPPEANILINKKPVPVERQLDYLWALEMYQGESEAGS